jgi:hypothetical protein
MLKRRPRGGPVGKPFQKGQNSHDGAVFRRGTDVIPRGTGVGLRAPFGTTTETSPKSSSPVTVLD